jgi:leucine dehydrogenase
MTPVGKNISELYAEAEHEKVVLWSDPQSKYRGIIAIHSTKLGPAVGGTRYFNYGCDKIASIDALRLSRAMSFKNALAGLPFGGGKAVIIGDHTSCNREQIFRAHGRFVESLKGEFITGEDVGTRPADMEVVHKETGYVAGLPGRSGDPARMTDLECFVQCKRVQSSVGVPTISGKRSLRFKVVAQLVIIWQKNFTRLGLDLQLWIWTNTDRKSS